MFVQHKPFWCFQRHKHIPSRSYPLLYQASYPITKRSLQSNGFYLPLRMLLDYLLGMQTLIDTYAILLHIFLSSNNLLAFLFLQTNRIYLGTLFSKREYKLLLLFFEILFELYTFLLRHSRFQKSTWCSFLYFLLLHNNALSMKVSFPRE